jgi:hypothetical protein
VDESIEGQNSEIGGIPSSQDSGIGKDPPVSRTLAGGPVIKRRRGRPPGITGRKPNQGYKIHNNDNSAPSRVSQMIANVEDNSDELLGHKEIMDGISAEKALQYNIVLQDINQKICRVSWKAF